ncbi:MAG: UDP-3-O-(3-hydroxymyristoyl)glucosamine N-acyltransferase [Alphaproteobacteria bacterium]|nr:UDP-3-O-(3-hydroxymyristoyl)glucosamine N-acyltransferase [Alphaproteobacteria bacterium]MBN2675278.1 UDP-3-O-(3-hydroxymyristoyl)glucosamine N-acyltransferase [Alphaproteobacteria bacterium]
MFKFIKSLFVPRGIKTTAGDLASKFGLELSGDPKTIIRGVAPIADAISGQLAFYSTEQNSIAFKILPISVLKNTKASVILLQPEQIKNAPKGATLLITNSPRGEIVKILGEIYKEKPRYGIHWSAHIEHGVFFRKKRSVYIGQFSTVERLASIDADVKIYPNVFIGRNVKLGRGTVIYSGAHIENATIGENCVIHSNAVIGKDGFGYTRQNGENIFIPHVGRVVIGDHVSIGANSCIDRGAMTDTVINVGTKIDNLCQIAHGVVIGKECFLASGVGIAGGTVIGDRVLLGGRVGMANGVKIGNDVEVGAMSGVFKNIPAGEKHIGYPAVPSMEFMRMHAWLKKQIKPRD